MKTVNNILAFSGGPDSMYLLHFLLKKGEKPVLAHLNHGLRGKESDLDEKFCKKIAKKHGLPFESEKISIKAPGIEEKARNARYKFLEKIRRKYKAKKIYTAHHLNDNLETVLLNFIRGTGLNGLTGIKSDKIERPLLQIPKSEILSFLKKNKIPYRKDSSNLDTKFSRNFIRHEIIPKLKKLNPNLEKIFQTNLENLLTIQDFLDKESPDSFTVSEFKRLHPAIQLNTLLQLAGPGVTQKQLKETQKLILSGKTGKKKNLGPVRIEIQYGKVVINPTQPAIKTTFRILKKHPRKLNQPKTIFLNFDKIKKLSKLKIRTPLPGDRIHPLGLKGSQKLQDLFTNKKIPQQLRKEIPVITNTKEILAVGWLAIAEKYRVTPRTKQILKISFKDTQ